RSRVQAWKGSRVSWGLSFFAEIRTRERANARTRERMNGPSGQPFALQRLERAIERADGVCNLLVLVEDRGEATRAHQDDAVAQHRFAQGVDRSTACHEKIGRAH